jgi:carotenoid cleavage dioxygenase
MDRRQFLRALAATAALIPLPAAPADALGWAAQFRAARAAKPWLVALAGTDRSRLETRSLRLEGRLPAALSGDFLRNGPARHEVFGERYHHWFDGDGMIQRFRIRDSKVAHLGRMVETEKYAVERAAGRALFDGFGTAIPGARPVRRPDDMNVANINVLQHGGALYALWEGGSAYELDTESLDTIGRKVWSAETNGLPFSAHPRREADGTLWSFGYASTAQALILYRIDPKGRLIDRAVVPMDPVPMIHDFMITTRYLLIPLPPLVFRRDRPGSFLDRHAWEPERGSRLLVVDKNDLGSRRIIDMPAHWVFHFGNAWEDEAGIIRFDMAAYDDPSIMFGPFRSLMRGVETPARPGRPVQVSLDMAAVKVRFEDLASGDVAAEFPRIDPRLQGQRNNHVVMLSRRAGGALHPFMNRVARFDFRSGDWDVHDYGPDVIAEEHILVPDPASAEETAGWVLGTSLDVEKQVTRLSIFAADRLNDGPVCVASLDYPLPLGLHGEFVPS